MDDKPTVFLLHGDDRYGIEQYIHGLLARMGDPGMAELNTTWLDARSASDEDLRTAAYSLPFLADRRLVILANPLAKLAAKNAQARFTALLDGLPSSTALVLPVDDTWGKRRGGGYGWSALHDGHFLIQWAQAAGKRALRKEFRLPSAGEMPGWISKAAREQGGQFTPQAAQTLAGLVGSDTLLATREIEKLLTYVDSARPVEAEDVSECTASTTSVSVFALTDVLAAGDRSAALRLLRQLLEEEDAIGLFAIIVSHFRGLLVTREILDEGGGQAQVVEALHRPPFVAGKLVEQARRFHIETLEAIYRRLAEIDVEMKSGITPPDLALEMLVVGL